MTARLSRQTLDQALLPAPTYLSHSSRIGIVHLGLGHFARAHLAVYLHHLLGQEPGDWRLIGVSLKSDKAAQQLNPQDGLYTVVTQADTVEAHLIGVVSEVISLCQASAQDRDRLVSHLVAPATKIVSLTITEKGYCRATDGSLDFSHPDIAHDLANPGQPRSAIGWLVLGLYRRWQQALEPFTPLCLDNLERNGEVLRRLVLDYARQQNPALADYIAEQVPFPSSMVDRIVPAANERTRALAEHELGLSDEAAIATEKYCQWVVEDRFVAGRPDLTRVGVTLCDDIEPFEQMKLRLLNGAHSTLAYLGLLLGCDTIAACMQQENLATFVKQLMTDEILPVVAPPPGIDLKDYINDLLTRFRNPHLQHRCEQIAVDGSQKLPNRLLPVIEARLDQGLSVTGLAFAVAAWFAFIQKTSREGVAINDPLADRLTALSANTPSGQLPHTLLTRSGVFPTRLRESSLWQGALEDAYMTIKRDGIERALSRQLTP